MHQFTLASSSISAEAPIPKIYTGEGRDVSPELEWANPPKGTKAYALICDDPDAPTVEPWVHWILYGIPSEVTELSQDVPRKPDLETPTGARQGKNSWGKIGYGGPMPPEGHGTHHYIFKLFALDQELMLPAGASKKELLSAMEGHILATAELIGTYQR